MCLQRKLELTPKVAQTKEGWKVFGVGFRGRLEFDNYGGPVEVNEWLKAIRCSVSYNESAGSYQSGFHVFLTRADAREWKKGTSCSCVIRKVRVRNIGAYGTQNGMVLKGGKCIVCDEMFVPA